MGDKKLCFAFQETNKTAKLKVNVNPYLYSIYKMYLNQPEKQNYNICKKQHLINM